MTIYKFAMTGFFFSVNSVSLWLKIFLLELARD
jgi:hypothetical protein